MPTLSAPDGTALYYEVFEPARPTCAVFFLPGWSDHAGRWTHVGERLRDAGMAAYMLDARGQGRAAGRRGHLSRDPAVGPAYTADPLVHQVMTAGAWREIQWAQRVLPADAHRVEAPVLFLLAGEDRIVDSQLARAFADSLKTDVQVRWYAEMYHEVLLDPQRDQVWTDTVAFLIDRGLARQRLPT